MQLESQVSMQDEVLRSYLGAACKKLQSVIYFKREYIFMCVCVHIDMHQEAYVEKKSYLVGNVQELLASNLHKVLHQVVIVLCTCSPET